MVSEREVQRNLPKAYRFVIRLVEEEWRGLAPGFWNKAQEAALDAVLERLKQLLYEEEVLEGRRIGVEWRAEHAKQA